MRSRDAVALQAAESDAQRGGQHRLAQQLLYTTTSCGLQGVREGRMLLLPPATVGLFECSLSLLLCVGDPILVLSTEAISRVRDAFARTRTHAMKRVNK